MVMRRRKRASHPEDAMQAALFRWLRVTKYRGRPIADFAWHTPNGGRRNPREAQRFRLLGVKPGVPDVFVAIPRDGSHGLFLELKAGRNTLTETQLGVQADLLSQGFAVREARSWDEAAQIVAVYLDVRGPNG
jgi:hypothetical protein